MKRTILSGVCAAAFALGSLPFVASADDGVTANADSGTTASDIDLGQANAYGSSTAYLSIADPAGLSLEQRLDPYPQGELFEDLLIPSGTAILGTADQRVPDLAPVNPYGVSPVQTDTDTYGQ